jgi:hypothetical protein
VEYEVEAGVIATCTSHLYNKDNFEYWSDTMVANDTETVWLSLSQTWHFDVAYRHALVLTDGNIRARS